MKCEWNEKTGELAFASKRFEGILEPIVSGDRGDSVSHLLRNFAHKSTSTLVSPDEVGYGPCRAGLFSLFKVLARGSYLTELRVVPPAMEILEDGVELVWAPTLHHQARVECTFRFKEPNIVDVDLRVEGYGYYPDYELLVSAYLAPGFTPGVYVKGDEFTDAKPEQIRIVDHPTFHGMYLFFPRDQAASHMLTDGRGQSGRYYWRQAISRSYARPVIFSARGTVDAVVLGRPEDVLALGASYAGDEERDGVAAHRSLYVSLFGRDLHPGHGWRTQVRLVVDDFGGREEVHMQLYEEFLAEVSSTERMFRTNPKDV